jgi:hypothetical protein
MRVVLTYQFEGSGLRIEAEVPASHRCPNWRAGAWRNSVSHGPCRARRRHGQVWQHANRVWIMTGMDRWTPKLSAIVAITYFAVGVGRLPGFRIDRAVAAFIGAA